MADKIEWDDSYLLGITEIDNQHKKLVEIANELYETASGSPEAYKLNMSRVLKKLTDYTVYHFTNEEEFQRKYGYAGVDIHKNAHDNFIKEVNFQIKQLSDNREDGMRFYSYMVNWILNHIAKADRVWANFVKPKLS